MEIEVRANRARVLNRELLAISFLHNFVTHSLKVGRPGVYLIFSPPGSGQTRFRGVASTFFFSNVEDDSRLFIKQRKIKLSRGTIQSRLIIDRYLFHVSSTVIEKKNGRANDTT